MLYPQTVLKSRCTANIQGWGITDNAVSGTVWMSGQVGRTLSEGAIHVCVLLVEDEPLIREIMAESLEDAGFAVIQAATGDDAISIIRNDERTITALVTDFHMPGQADGADVASCVRQKWPNLPVVIASGRPDIMKLSWQAHSGYRLLRKPYGPRQLIGVLRELTLAA
jgi:DNA-binding response OmpR family regulator